MHKEDTQVLVAMRDTFEGAPLTTLEWKGRPCWVAGEIDRALGLPDNLSGSRWAARSNDYREGADGEQVTGEALDALKAAGLVGANAPSATVFYESGVTLYLMASRAEKARAFRWRLVDVVLPALREHAAQQGKAHLLAAVGTSRDRTALVWAATGQERVALWRAAESLHKAETQAQRAALDVEQKRKTRELMEHRRLIAEMNQAERRRLVGRLLVEMQHEIEDRRAKVKSPRTVERLAEKVATAALDERCGQGLAPNLLREVMTQ